ncbi:MAG: bifunctional 5,10-methylenetetrahydrofolate dehydrogenase/5,10-methenyltetrahydrofolate cyclohydrolase [Patescibacteria group bacterium]|jgi:methylenetetrahydrofolate dehydrogenase (NADP+)/methenyltetrahydrofolate cyclohydrolase
MAKIFSGKDFADRAEQKLIKKFSSLPAKLKELVLVDILIGNDKSAQAYVNLKKAAAGRVGINFEAVYRSEKASGSDLLALVNRLNQDRRVGGIMFQLPFPENLRDSQREVIDNIYFEKDVDCLTSRRLERVVKGENDFLPATVAAVVKILAYSGVSDSELVGKRIVVVGRSDIVGRPLAAFLKNHKAKVTVCHRQTKRLSDYTQSAEVLVSATGRPDLIKENMVAKGAVVIDVGSPKGDVDLERVRKRASFITPVPGGVGPVTVICLLENFIKLLYQKN